MWTAYHFIFDFPFGICVTQNQKVYNNNNRSKTEPHKKNHLFFYTRFSFFRYFHPFCIDSIVIFMAILKCLEKRYVRVHGDTCGCV